MRRAACLLLIVLAGCGEPRAVCEDCADAAHVDAAADAVDDAPAHEIDAAVDGRVPDARVDAAIDATACHDTCPTVDALDCSGATPQRCAPGPDGCLAWIDAPGAVCEDGASCSGGVITVCPDADGCVDPAERTCALGCDGDACAVCTAIDDPVIGRSEWSPDVGVYDLVTDGNRVYVASGKDGVRIYDVGADGTPVLLGTTDTPGFAWGVAVRGTLLYVADGTSGLTVLDVSNPALPVVHGSVVFSDAQKVVLSGNYAYVTCWGVALRVVEIVDPAIPVVVGGYYSTTEEGYDLAISGTKVYIADYKGEVLTFDVSNPYAVKLRGRLEVSGNYIGGIAARGTVVYVANLTSGVTAWDLHDPEVPEHRGTVNLGFGMAHDVVLDGDRLWVASAKRGLEVIDVSAAAPTLVGAYRLAGETDLIRTLPGGRILVGGFGQGPTVIDGAAALAMITSGSITPLRPEFIQGDLVSDGVHAYVTSTNRGLEILDLTQQPPVVVGTLPVPGGAPMDVAYADGRVYVAASAGGLLIVDVGDPTAPKVIGHHEVNAWRVAAAGSWAFVWDGSGLDAIFVGNPAHPSLAARLPHTASIEDLVLSGGYIYAAAFYEGLKIFDVRDPYRPTFAIRFDTAGRVLDVDVDGGLAVLADQDMGLYVVDVSTPAKPHQLALQPTPGEPTAVALVGDHAYVGDHGALYVPPGLRVADLRDPAHPVLRLGFAAPFAVADVAVTSNEVLMAIDGESNHDDALMVRPICH